MTTLATPLPVRKPPIPAHGTCRFVVRGTIPVIEINGEWYDVAELTDRGQAVGVRLTKHSTGETYDLDREYGGTCECRDFVYRRQGKDPRGCKHLLAARALGLLPRL